MRKSKHTNAFKKEIVRKSNIVMARGVTLREFAESVGLTEGTLSSWRYY